MALVKNNMAEDGRHFNFFVPQDEIEATERFLENTDVDLDEFYKMAFEAGREVMEHRIMGDNVYASDRSSGREYPLAGSERPRDKKILYLDSYRNDNER